MASNLELLTSTRRGVSSMLLTVLKMDLVSFRIQIKNTAQMHHSECFVGNGLLITDHPLRE
eukprot:197412-Rhodomonas_salina.1